MTREPLPRHYDYQGNERGLGYVRGVTSVRCGRCNTTGKGSGRNAPWCDDCGGYGCVPKNAVTVADNVADEAQEKVSA